MAVMVGSPTDNNATLFAQGYDAVLAPNFSSGAYVKAASPAGTWDPPTAETEFQQALTAHPGINAAVVPNDENAAPIITYLKTLGIAGQQVPDHRSGRHTRRHPEHHLGLPVRHGLQADLPGGPGGRRARPVPAGRQDGSPSALANGTAKDTVSHTTVKSVLLKPEWVTPTNVEQTVVKDGFVPASQICTGAYAADCTKYGIS